MFNLRSFSFSLISTNSQTQNVLRTHEILPTAPLIAAFFFSIIDYISMNNFCFSFGFLPAVARMWDTPLALPLHLVSNSVKSLTIHTVSEAHLCQPVTVTSRLCLSLTLKCTVCDHFNGAVLQKFFPFSVMFDKLILVPKDLRPFTISWKTF